MLKYLAPLLLSIAASPVLAESAVEPAPSAVVTYRDLDLSRAEGRAALDTRLRAASKQVCPGRHDSSSAQTSARRACLKATLQSARQLAAVAIAGQRPVMLASADPAEKR